MRQSCCCCRRSSNTSCYSKAPSTLHKLPLRANTNPRVPDAGVPLDCAVLAPPLQRGAVKGFHHGHTVYSSSPQRYRHHRPAGEPVPTTAGCWRDRLPMNVSPLTPSGGAASARGPQYFCGVRSRQRSTHPPFSATVIQLLFAHYLCGFGSPHSALLFTCSAWRHHDLAAT